MPQKLVNIFLRFNLSAQNAVFGTLNGDIGPFEGSVIGDFVMKVNFYGINSNL